jgi:hypothetical protein
MIGRCPLGKRREEKEQRHRCRQDDAAGGEARNRDGVFLSFSLFLSLSRHQSDDTYHLGRGE